MGGIGIFEISQRESEIANITGIRRLLNERYGKAISERDSLVQSLWWKVRERGVRSSLHRLWIALRERGGL